MFSYNKLTKAENVLEFFFWCHYPHVRGDTYMDTNVHIFQNIA